MADTKANSFKTRPYNICNKRSTKFKKSNVTPNIWIPNKIPRAAFPPDPGESPWVDLWALGHNNPSF